jgi:type III pantothenate kinase
VLLAINIGNTNISFGVFSNNTMTAKYSVPTVSKKYAACLKSIFAGYEIEDVIICSVVPRAQKILEHDLSNILRKRPGVHKKNLKVPIHNLYRVPRQTGQDRLVNAYAGAILYGSPLIIADFGSAITIDVVSKDKKYLGGMILPGLNMSLQALSENTALLPRIKLRKPKGLIGNDTASSMLSGVVLGSAAAADEIIRRLKVKIGPGAKAIATGGNIDLINEFCREFDKIDKDLTLKGLNIIHKKGI